MRSIYENIINFNPDIFMAVALTVLFSLEQLFSNVKSLFQRTPHLLNNIFLQFGYVLLNFGLATLVIKCLDWTNENKFGLFNLVHIPYYLKVIVGVL